MSSTNDPTRQLKRAIAITAVLGMTVCAWCAIWAWQPMPKVAPTGAGDVLNRAAQPNTSEADADATVPFNADAFLTTLWYEPPPPPAPPDDDADEQKQREPEPLRVQLVAIIEDNGEFQAALFDLLEDRIVIVSSGDMIQDHEVRVRPDAVEFIHGEQHQQLLLRPDERLAKGGR